MEGIKEEKDISNISQEEIKNSEIISEGEIIEDKNLSQEILSNIKEHKIAPRPRWQFLFRNYFLWTIGFLALFFGAVSISLIIFMLRYNEWSSYSRLGGGPLDFLLLVVPIFWIISLAIFVILVYFNFKKTKHGYRFKPLLIVSGAIAISVILGFAFFSLGMGQRIDAVLGRRAPLYDSLINPGMRFWSNPEAGRLSGLLVYQESEGNFILVDNNNIEWHVNYIESNDEKLAEAKKNGMIDDETLIIAAGQPVRFIGEITAEKEFKAKEMVPFHPGREFFYRFEKGHGPKPGKNMMPNGAKFGGTIPPDINSVDIIPSDLIPPEEATSATMTPAGRLRVPKTSEIIMEIKK